MNNNISNIISTTADKAQEAMKNNTVFGEAITIDGTTIIPVYKVSFGFGGGGVDGIRTKNGNSVAGAAGAGVTKKPISYITVTNGELTVLSAEEGEANGIFDKIINFIKKK